ncbi:MAG: glycoside hydrolase family 5 protein [Lachnospiraceae bacterium]|nr:glycoside hydrolase family 5 protein [Lachnospiraceae bacterium]
MAGKKAVPAPFTKGVNFTNWLEFRRADEINPELFTKQDFANAKKLGCDVIRIPMHFEKICEGMEGYRIPKSVYGILDNIAAWAEELKMYVIFDFHNNCHVDSKTSENVEEVLAPIWTQLAERYKDASEYIVYELMNEPHGIAVSLWNEIIERLFRKVRDIDKKHYIIAGGADWNSFAAMKTLPDFQDDKVIYTFHFYDPHTFTHQGAGWSHLERVVNIPFPYSPDRMPDLPENPTEDEKARFAAYPEQGTVEAVQRFFDQYVEFSIERNAPVLCGEFGCFAPFAKHEERVNWYTIVSGLLAERGIARTSWDYYGGFGIFKFDWEKIRARQKPEWKFPEDLDLDIVKAMGLNTELV